MITNEAIATQVSEAILQICESLNETVITAQQRCPPDEFKRYRRAVAAVLAEINDQILNPLYSDHPSLEPPAPEQT
jgi:hypothetical protein